MKRCCSYTVYCRYQDVHYCGNVLSHHVGFFLSKRKVQARKVRMHWQILKGVY